MKCHFNPLSIMALYPVNQSTKRYGIFCSIGAGEAANLVVKSLAIRETETGENGSILIGNTGIHLVETQRKQGFSRLTSLEEEFYYGIRGLSRPGHAAQKRVSMGTPGLRFRRCRHAGSSGFSPGVPMRLSCIGSLIRGGSRLLESFLGHHLIEEPSDEGLHSHFLIRKIFSINTKGAMAWVLLSANLG